MQTVLRGARFRPFEAQLQLLKLKAGDRVALELDDDNKFDPGNAIKILHPDETLASDERFLGFVAKEDCPDVRSMLAVGYPVIATILEENGNSPSIQIEHDLGTSVGPEAA
jgi:hypothetical protein